MQIVPRLYDCMAACGIQLIAEPIDRDRRDQSIVIAENGPSWTVVRPIREYLQAHPDGYGYTQYVAFYNEW